MVIEVLFVVSFEPSNLLKRRKNENGKVKHVCHCVVDGTLYQ